MALVTPRTRPSVDANQAMKAFNSAGLVAGEILLACSPIYIKQSDGKAYMSNATGTAEASGVHGLCPAYTLAGEAVTPLGPGTRFGYATGLTPGKRYFVGGTAGRIDSAATVGDTAAMNPIFFAYNATDLVFCGYHAIA